MKLRAEFEHPFYPLAGGERAAQGLFERGLSADDPQAEISTDKPVATAAPHQMNADPIALAVAVPVLKSARSRKDARTPPRAAPSPTNGPHRPAAKTEMKTTPAPTGSMG